MHTCLRNGLVVLMASPQGLGQTSTSPNTAQLRQDRLQEAVMKRLLILLMLVSQPAWAEWVRIGSWDGGKDGGKATFYIDPATVRKTANGRRAWSMRSHEQPFAVGFTSHQSAKTLDEFDCAGERYRKLQSSWYSGPMGTGQSVWSSDEPDRWTVVIPESIAEIQLQAACSVPLK
jgi:hypothetical protein